MKLLLKGLGLLFAASLVFQLAIAVVSGIAVYWYFSIPLAAIIASPWIIRYIRMRKYFSSPEFTGIKEYIAEFVSEHNEISGYVEEIRSQGTFSVGQSSTARHASLASSTNTSRFAYKRDKNVADVGSTTVHHASLQVVRNAALEPLKYLIKYFDISPTEDKLEEVESLGESVSRLENAVQNLKEREDEIADLAHPPKFILKHYKDRFYSQVGLEIPAITIPYPTYKFQYVSAGGNSSQETKIRLDMRTIDALIQRMSEVIKFRNSVAGQRALMTASLRNRIKERDGHACRICSISIENEPHLLLEIDHIVPVSKGGLSIEENLQALCWKCNRTKSNK